MLTYYCIVLTFLLILQLETELHASQLQLQAIHTYPSSSSSNNTPQLTHLHMGSAVAATTTANPLQTAAVQRRPGVPTTNTISSRNLPMVSQPSVTRTPLSQLPTVGVCSNTLPLPWCNTELMSSRVTCTEVPSIHASYPAYFTASSRNPNHTNVNFGNDHTQRGSSTTTVYPSLSPMDSLSTTSISHGQGVPLSSTHVQHYSQQEECLAGNRHPHIKVDSPSSSDATSGPLQHGDKCYGREVPTIEHHVTHNATCTGPEKQQHQAGVSQSELEVPISTSTTCRTEPTTPPLPVRQHWLSLPSATPEQRSSPCDRKMKREGNLLQKKADSGVGGSCREIGTQTLYVESVSTQTDLDGEKRDQPPTSSAIIGQMNVSSSSPTLTKGSVDSTAMSVGDLHAIAPSDSPQPNTKLSITERTPRPRPDQGINGSHSAPQDFNQLNSEDTLMEELLTASFLLNSQGALAVGSQAGSHGSSSTSKEAELLRLE